MMRYYYIRDNLDDLDQIEEELEASGLHTPQIHVLSNNDSGVRIVITCKIYEPFLKRRWRMA